MASRVVYRQGNYPKSLPTKVYLDANFLFDCRIPYRNFYKAANALFGAFIMYKGSTFYVSTLALDEVWKKTPQVAAGIVIRNKQDWANQVSQFQSQLDTFKRFIERHVRAGKLIVVGVPEGVVNEAYDIMINTPIMPRDAFHIATALHHGITDIISRDADLVNVNRRFTVHQY